jgi:hypothetical protein
MRARYFGGWEHLVEDEAEPAFRRLTDLSPQLRLWCSRGGYLLKAVSI